MSESIEQAAACNRQGIALAQAGRFEDAVAYFRRALELLPDWVDAYNNVGNVLSFLGRLDEAIACYDRGLRVRPDDADLHNNLGHALWQLGRWSEAEASCRRALAQRPQFAEAHNNLGIALQRQGRLEEAEACFRQALWLRPDLADASQNLAMLLHERRQLDEAAGWYRRAIDLRPDFPEAQHGLAAVLIERGELDQGAALCDQALRLRPGLAEAHVTLAEACWKRGEASEALRCCQEALRLKPDLAIAHEVAGTIHLKLADLGAALAHFDRGLVLAPTRPELHARRGLVLLSQGDFRRGWPEFDWRWRCPGFQVGTFPCPLWDGSPLAGRTIFLVAEQGQGDILQFIRFAPLVKQQGATVVAACPEALTSLLSRCAGIDLLVSPAAVVREADVCIPMLSLPRLLGITVDTIPNQTPYLFADPQLVEAWSQRLRHLWGRKVGISWQGNPAHPDDRLRSVPLGAFRVLAEVEGIELVSLQTGPGVDQLAHWSERKPLFPAGEALQTFDDTAALVKNLDLVITVDTAVAHLAGGLGIPVWVALPMAADWRWLQQREDSPWYPTMRLFRQTRWAHWQDVFARMAAELARGRSDTSSAGVTVQGFS
jgi:tetratricopeptide (TPR) repeat protein